jgi:hypothetical protein
MEKDFPEGVLLRDSTLTTSGVTHKSWPYSLWWPGEWEPWPAGSTVLIKIHKGALNVHEWDNWVTNDKGHINCGADFPDVVNPLDVTFRFSTEKGIVPVAVIYPGNSSKNVPLNPTITVVFNRDVLPERDFNGHYLFENITLRPYRGLVKDSNSHSMILPSGIPVPMIRSIEGNKVTFRLDNAMLTPLTQYEITFPRKCLIAADDSRISLPWPLGVDFVTGNADGSRGTVAGGPDDANTSGSGSKPSSASTSLVIAAISIIAGAVLYASRKKH